MLFDFYTMGIFHNTVLENLNINPKMTSDALKYINVVVYN